MYRNNFRSPQMGQPRPIMNFANRGCGMQRPCQTQGNDCGVTTQPDCGCDTPRNECCEPASCCEPQCCGSAQRNECCEPVSCCVRPMPLPANGCGCGEDEPDTDCFPSKQDPVSGMALAMAYVPWQDYRNICSEEEAWCRGTIFAQLDLEFMARRCN